MEEEMIDIQLPREEFELLKAAGKDWPAYQDYSKRQNELNFHIERQEKERKNVFSLFEKITLIGLISLSILSLLSFVILIWFAITGIGVGLLPLILGGTAALLFGVLLFQFFRIFQAGEWFKFGLDIRKHKCGWLKFTKGRGLMLYAAPYTQKSEFRKGNDKTIFLTKGKGYHDASTGATLFTVREGAISDFDVDEEYKGKIEDIGKDVKQISQESWFAGAIWNKIDLPQLKILLIIAIICAGVAALFAMGGIALNYQSQDTLNARISAMDGNMTLIIKDIQNKVSTLQNNQGVITGG